jgi:hypothetical protein
MRIAEYCRGESEFLLLPIEHLSPEGSDADLAAFLRNECGWNDERIALVDNALALYWSRSKTLADKTRAWPRPRIRNIGIATDVAALRPYAQVLNTSTWSLYDCDLDTNAEFVAFLLALGDWMAVSGEVTQAPVLAAAWWIVADDDACAAFKTAAKTCQRPDGDSLRAIAKALPWLTDLRQRSLRPAADDEICREIPTSGVQVPKRHEAKPQRLVNVARDAARAALEAHREAWRDHDGRAKAGLFDWLAEAVPTVVVTGSDATVVWDPADATRTEALDNILTNADEVAIESIRADLLLIDQYSRRFTGALVDPDALPLCEGALAESGYAYMSPKRNVIAYNAVEPGIERLVGPPLPYERAMLGARVLHEWAHVADQAGWVQSRVDDAVMDELRGGLAAELDAAVLECSPRAAEAARADLDELASGRAVGEALADLLLTRLPDYRANLIARAFMSKAERETYVRHNIRSLRNEYKTPQLWRAVVRYLYEYQYLLPALSLTTIEDPLRFFTLSTGFAAEFIDEGVVTAARFDSITRALTRLLDVYRVDTEKIRLPASGQGH